MTSPSIACIGIIGKENNPLSISLFPPNARSEVEFSLLLSSTLDIFEARLPQKSVNQDFGLLHAIDERLACYGWLTNTSVKFVIVVDMAGRPAGADGSVGARGAAASVVGLRDADLKPAFRAIQTAYVRLLQNPFYEPDLHSPLANNGHHKSSTKMITSRTFLEEMKRIGETWAPGVSNL